MQVRVLGCSGGIGRDRHTTSFLIDDDCLIDAGSGALRLSLEELARIDHVFITHSHLDHILALPLMLDSVSGMRDKPVILHATGETLAILQGHLFNWLIWPDFSRIPTPVNPFLRYQRLTVGQAVNLGEREITPIPAEHTVPAVGYLLRGPYASLLFSGDTESHPALWEWANAAQDLKDMIIETSFTDDLCDLARLSKHYCPKGLVQDAPRLMHEVRLWITHLKPGREDAILDEINGQSRQPIAQALMPDQVFIL